MRAGHQDVSFDLQIQSLQIEINSNSSWGHSVTLTFSTATIKFEYIEFKKPLQVSVQCNDGKLVSSGTVPTTTFGASYHYLVWTINKTATDIKIDYGNEELLSHQLYASCGFETQKIGMDTGNLIRYRGKPIGEQHLYYHYAWISSLMLHSPVLYPKILAFVPSEEEESSTDLIKSNCTPLIHSTKI